MKKLHPYCSVVIPIYNKKQYIRETLKSIVSQDCRGQFEIILVDDGSTDGGADGLDELDPRVRLIRQKNQGAAVARYIGVVAAKSDIVVFHDADDIADSSKLRVLVDGLLAHPECVASFAVVKTHAKTMNGSTTARIIQAAQNQEVYVIQDPVHWMLCSLGPLALAMNLAVRRVHALDAAQGRDFYKAANDYDFQLRMATKGPFVFLNKMTNYYRTSNSGITSVYGSASQAAYATLAARDVYQSLNKSPEYKKAFLHGIRKRAPTGIVGMFFRKEYWFAVKLFWLTFSAISIKQLLREGWWVFERERAGRENPGLIYICLSRLRDVVKK